MATNLNKLFVFVPSAKVATYKSTTGKSGDYLNKIAFLEGTGEIMTKGQVFAVNSSSDISALKTIIGQSGSSWKSFADGITATDVITAINQVKALVDANTTSIGDSSSGLTKRVSDLETSVDTATTGLKDRMTVVESKASTLVGSDTGKSARAIAAEEVAKVVANADASFDTLKEIADWILSDTTGAAKMASDISSIQTEIGTASEGEAGKEGYVAATGLHKRIEDIEEELDGLSGGAGSIAQQIDTKVATLDASITLAGTTASQPSTVTRSTSIDVLGSVTVSETDGKIDAEAAGKSAKVVLQADAAGAAQKAYEDLLGASTDASDGSVITLHGVKNYAAALVSNKNVGAQGDNNLIAATASNNTVTVSATQTLQTAVGNANTALQSVTLSSGNTTYITVASESGSGSSTQASASISPVLGTLTNNNSGTDLLSYTAGLASTKSVADAINAIEVWETIS